MLGLSTFFRFRYAFFDGMWVDEGRYARIALDIASHPLSYTSEAPVGRGPPSLPPVFPYLLAVSSYIFPNADFAVRVVSPLLSVGAIGLTYRIGSEMKNKTTGLMAAVFLAIIPTFWFMSERILVEATLTAVYAAAIFSLYYGFEDREFSRYALYALGPLTAIAIMTKQPAYTLGPVILFYTAYKKWEVLEELYEDFDAELLKNEFKDFGIAVGLGALTLVPWSLNGLNTCGFPLCGLLSALSFATASSGGVNSAVFSVQSSFYFITALPGIVAVPVAALVFLRAAYYVLDLSDEARVLARRLGAMTVLTVLAFVVQKKLVPMALISSLALLARTDHEKLLWLWTGIGIGFMSIPAVKVPRYITFVFPALAMISAITVYDLSGWIGRITESSLGKYGTIALLLGLTLFLTFPQGIARMQQMDNPNSPMKAMEEAGNWLDRNTSENATIVASSNRQMMFYAYPRLAYFPKDNRTVFEQNLQERDVDYVVVDVYEKAQPRWMQYMPPFRIPNSDRQALNQGRISPQQFSSRFGPSPDYLEQVKVFGRSRMPLTQSRAQPQFIVYRVNQTALR